MSLDTLYMYLVSVRYFSQQACVGHFGHLVIWSKSIFEVSKRHYNKYYIFIYSEQMTQSENENDHFDLDHFDRIDKCLVVLP